VHCVWSSVYRLEQLAPRPKCVISRHQVLLLRVLPPLCFFPISPIFSPLWCNLLALQTTMYSNIPLSPGQWTDGQTAGKDELWTSWWFGGQLAHSLHDDVKLYQQCSARDKSQSDLSCKWCFVIRFLFLSHADVFAADKFSSRGCRVYIWKTVKIFVLLEL